MKFKIRLLKEKSADMMCMFDDLAYVDDFPGYDHQGDDYVVEFDDDCSEKPTLSSWEEEVQLPQCQNENQTLHTNQDCCSDQSVEDAIDDMKVFLNPELQLLTYIDFQIPYESLEPETKYELIQNFGISPMDKALVYVFRFQWYFSSPQRATIPRWILCWGPIIIGNLILQLFIWRCSRDEDILLVGLG
jgi:hypothetical protein